MGRRSGSAVIPISTGVTPSCTLAFVESSGLTTSGTTGVLVGRVITSGIAGVMVRGFITAGRSVFRTGHSEVILGPNPGLSSIASAACPETRESCRSSIEAWGNVPSSNRRSQSLRNLPTASRDSERRWSVLMKAINSGLDK